MAEVDQILFLFIHLTLHCTVAFAMSVPLLEPKECSHILLQYIAPSRTLKKNPFLPVTVVVLVMQRIKRESDKLTRIMQNGELHHHLGSHWRGSRLERQLSWPMETMRMDMHQRGHLKVALKIKKAM